MDELFRAVRAASPPPVWSKGVELARGDGVTGDKDTGAEVHLRVKAANGGISSRVILSVDDTAWECTCGSDDDPCAHVAAAVIAIRRAREQGKSLPQSAAAAGRLVYRFLRDPTPGSNNILFIRRIATGAAEEALPAPLLALTTGRVRGPSFAATAEDLGIDQAIQGERSEVLPAKAFSALFQALSTTEGLTFDGKPVRVDAAPVGPVVVVRDEGPGVRVEAAPDPEIAETFANGVALCAGGTLRPIVRPQLTPPEQEILRSGRFFGRQELGFLVAEILPGLEAKMKLVVRTDKLPRRTDGKPRLELGLTGTGESLSVEPAIVYGDPVTARVKGGLLYTYGNTVPARDMDAERRLKDELARALGLDLEQMLSLPAADAVQLVQRLGRWGGDVVGPGAEQFAVHAALTPDFSVNNDSFSIAFASGDRRAAPEAVLKAFRAGESLVPLLDGGYAPLPTDWLTRYGDRIRELLAARGEREGAPLPKAASLVLADVTEELGLSLPPGLAALRESLAAFEKIPRYTPKNLRAELRDYQRRGVDWLAFLRSQGLGALLADDMGLGKTLQTIAVIDGRTLVVAPTSVAPNWTAELARFRPDLKVSLYHGGGRELDPSADVTITTYAILRLDLARLSAEKWAMAVLDEAQAIKNPDSQVARAALKIDAGFRVALSGTPVENRLDDLFSQMRFLNPGLLGDRKTFQELFARRVEQGDDDAARRLRQRVKPFVLRRLKSEVAPELPPRTDVVLHVTLSGSERERYEAIKAATRREVLEKLAESGNVLQALEALLRLRQAACHPDLLPGVEGEASSKVFAFIERLEESLAGQHKALVFSQWTGFLDLLEPALGAAGVRYSRLDGSTVDRQAVVREFQAAGGPDVLIMSLKAGGVGLNLTAADHVFIMDPWWNPAAEDQAADRAHRIGQENPVLVHRLVALDTVEERILALQDKKRMLAAAAIDGGAAGSGLTREDLLALFD